MTDKIKVRLEVIKYGGWDKLEVAINCVDPKQVLVTYPTAETILNYKRNNLRKKIDSKSLKTFAGERLIVAKTVEVVSLSVVGTHTMQALDLDDFRLMATWEAFTNSNLDLIHLLAVGFTDSLRSIALEQLGTKLELEERQDHIASRLSGVETRKTLEEVITDWWHNEHDPSKPVPPCALSSPSNLLNEGLTGFKAKYWREKLGITTDDALRDAWCAKQLKRIETVEEIAKNQISKNGMTPIEAIKFALAATCYEVWSEEELFGTNDPKTIERNRKRAYRARRNKKAN
jgi:hypothetical protein